MEKPNITLNALNYANSKFKRDDDPKGWDASYYGYIEGAELISKLLEDKVEPIKEKAYEDMSVYELMQEMKRIELAEDEIVNRIKNNMSKTSLKEQAVNDLLKHKSIESLNSKVFLRPKFGIQYWSHDIMEDQLRVTFRYYISEEDFRNGSNQMFGYFYIKDDVTKSV